MARTIRRFRAVFVALTALAISAGAVFAARALPPAAQAGLDRAADASGRTVPARTAPAEQPEAPATEGPEIEEPGTQEPGSDKPENEEPEAPDEGGAAESHGAIVSAAAQADTPDGYRNHGAYVSEVARQNKGRERSAEARSGLEKPANAPNAKPPKAKGPKGPR